MNTTPLTNARECEATALECEFPIVEVSRIAEQESWRKEINRPLSHIHKWWAIRLGSVFRAITLAALSRAGSDTWKNFYKRHRFAGKVVLDPFMGSGTTLGEAIKLGATMIGYDINPVSTFLVRQAFIRVAETQLRANFERLERKVAPEIRHYYQTRAPRTGELIPVLYYFWVKTVTTPDGETVPLFSRYVFAQDAYPKKKPKAQVVCPSCWGIIEDRYDATDLACPCCGHRFNPQKRPSSGQYVTTKNGNRYRIKDLLSPGEQPLVHRLYAILALQPDGRKVYLPAREEDFALYAEAEARLACEVLPLPTMAIRPGHNTDQARGYNYLHWRDFFNARQLLCLGLLLQAILELEDEVSQEQLLCLFSSTLEFNNLFCSFKGEGTSAVRHLFSNHILKPERTPLENSVWGTDKSSGTFSTLFESRLLPAKRYLDEPFEVDFERDLFGELIDTRKTVASEPIRTRLVDSWEHLTTTENGLMILNGDSSRLALPDASVDAVITDPPYFDFVHYSELSDFFFAWLAPVLESRYPWFARPDSSDKGEVQNKNPRVFAQQLGAVFSECCRVLKDEGVLAFSFHHSRAEGWAAIYEAITAAGLIVVVAHPVHAELRAASPKAAAKDPISLDAILVCKKRSQVNTVSSDQQVAIRKSLSLAKKLLDAGMSLSTADHFVIVASQMLATFPSNGVDFDSACSMLRQAHQATQQRTQAQPYSGLKRARAARRAAPTYIPIVTVPRPSPASCGAVHVAPVSHSLETSPSTASFTALLLAGRRGPVDPIALSVGCSHKVLVPVAGVPMIVRVVRTLRAAHTVSNIVVCTDDPSAFANLDELQALVPPGTLSFSLSTGQSPSESVMQYLRRHDAQQPILVTTADHPLLIPEMVDYFCTAAASTPADVAVGIVAESTFRRQYPHSKRSFFPLKDDSFCGTNLFALLTPAAMAAVHFWNHAGQFRKRPWRLIGTFGLLNLLRFALRRPDLATVVPRASRVIGARAAAVQMPFPECAIDVDTLDDLETATRIVQEREGNKENDER